MGTCYSKFNNRFIPTPVGNTSVRLGISTQQAVHPHACGEHARRRLICDMCNGSSPRLWGTQLPGREFSNSSRFIPMPVGNTSHRLAAARKWPVHPHACGEHRRRHFLSALKTGSSPRLWGTRKDLGVRPEKHRFIPTPVGNTEEGYTPEQIASVHPHACGEHLSGEPFANHSDGSSPRLWGTPLW